MYSLSLYNSSLKSQWDNFINESKNGVFDVLNFPYSLSALNPSIVKNKIFLYIFYTSSSLIHVRIINLFNSLSSKSSKLDLPCRIL